MHHQHAEQAKPGDKVDLNMLCLDTKPEAKGGTDANTRQQGALRRHCATTLAKTTVGTTTTTAGTMAGTMKTEQQQEHGDGDEFAFAMLAMPVDDVGLNIEF